MTRESISVVASRAESTSRRTRREVERKRARPRPRRGRARSPRRAGSPARSGTRPADVCGCVRSPRASSAANSLRTVDGETFMLAALDEVLRADRLAGRDVLLDDEREQDPRWRSLRSGLVRGHLQEILACARSVSASRSAVTPPPRNRPRRVSASVAAVAAVDETEALEPRERLGVERRRRARRARAARRVAGRASPVRAAASSRRERSSSRGGTPRRPRAPPGSAASPGVLRHRRRPRSSRPRRPRVRGSRGRASRRGCGASGSPPPPPARRRQKFAVSYQR